MKAKSVPYFFRLIEDIRHICDEAITLIAFLLLMMIDGRDMRREYEREVPLKNKSLYKWYKDIWNAE